MSEKRNGWSNYETYTWHLWYGDDLSYFEDSVREIGNDPYKVGELLEEITEEWAENYELLDGKGFFSDMIYAALQKVNWYEIAEHIIKDLGIAEEEEDKEPATRRNRGGVKP